MQLGIILYYVNFIRTLFVIAIIYFAIRVFSRYILPHMIQKGIKNMQQKMHEQYREKQRTGRSEGEVTIEKNNTSRKNDQPDEGEYIDFEEVD